MGRMPSGAEERAARRELTREAARRRAVTTLEVAGAVASYAARQLGNGLSPQEAQAAALEVALELESVVLALLRLVRAPEAAGYRGAAGAGRSVHRGGRPHGAGRREARRGPEDGTEVAAPGCGITAGR